jgi:predicted nucleotidyltransferase
MEPSNLIPQIVDRLKTVPGIQAVVLGGSRARQTHTPTSDIDLGIYYSSSLPLDLAELGWVATEIDDEHRADVVTGIGGWGPWINGGGWLKVNDLPVDLLYRDLDKVSQVITDCREGRFEMAYQPGHPHGFASYIYLSEAALCLPLWDTHGTVAALKARVTPYPTRLQQAIIAAFWWEADFSLKVGQKSISRGDVAYAAGCCFRAVVCLAQTLFAVNRQYWMNEKGAIAMAASFPIGPKDLNGRVETAFDQLDHSPQGIGNAIAALQELVEECAPLVAASGQPG